MAGGETAGARVETAGLRLLVVARSPLFAEALARFLTRQAGFVGAHVGFDRAAAIAEGLQPHVVLVDADIDRDTVVATAQQLQRVAPQARLLLVAPSPGAQGDRLVAEIGAAGCV